MARIGSRPLPLSPWEYYFYLDVDGNLNQDHVQRALQEIKTYTNTFRMIGNYEKEGIMKNIVLIGIMGSGKTTFGKILYKKQVMK